MKITFAPILLALALCGLAVSSYAKTKTAGDLSDACLMFEKAAANDLTFQDAAEAIGFGTCMGYFEGYIDGAASSGSKLWWQPASDTALSPRNMEGAFRIYMNQHPEAAKDDAATT